MTYWIYPARGRAVVVKAQTHEEARKKIEASPEYDGGKLVVVNLDFYITLCETGALEAALAPIEEF